MALLKSYSLWLRSMKKLINIFNMNSTDKQYNLHSQTTLEYLVRKPKT